MLLQAAFQKLAVPLARDPVEDDARERHGRIVPCKPADQRRRRGPLPSRIDHQHHRPARQPG
jgi:hypothetical protein